MKKALSVVLTLAVMATSLFAFGFTAEAKTKSTTIDDVYYKYTVKDGKVRIDYADIGDEYSESTFEIPSEIEGKAVVSIKGIHVYADNVRIKTLIIPDSVETIGSTANGDEYDAFYCGEVFKTVKLGKGVKNIYYNPITTGEKITVAKGNKYLTVKDGVLYNKEKTVLYAYPPYRKAKSFTVPSTVKTIKAYAFAETGRLGKVDTKNVKTIEEDAFRYSGINTLILGKNVKSFTAEATVGCLYLKTVKIASSNKYFKMSKSVVFNKKKTKLVLYPLGLSKTGYTVPKSVKTIGKNAFCLNETLRKINVPKSVVTIEAGAFSNCYNAIVNVPSKVKTVGPRAYEGIASTKLTFPKTVTKLGYQNFRFSFSLKSVDLSKTKIKKIERGTFQYTDGLRSVKLPSTVESIGEGAFIFSGISEIKLPSNLKKIGKYAFEDTQIRSITVPASVEKVYDGAFKSEFLERIIFKGENTELAKFAVPVTIFSEAEEETKHNPVIIVAPKGSKAHKYAEKYELTYEEL